MDLKEFFSKNGKSRPHCKTDRLWYLIINENIIRFSNPQRIPPLYSQYYNAEVPQASLPIRWPSLPLAYAPSSPLQSVIRSPHFELLLTRFSSQLLPFLRLHSFLYQSKITLFNLVSTLWFMPTFHETFRLFIFLILFLDHTLNHIVFFLMSSW